MAQQGKCLPYIHGDEMWSPETTSVLDKCGGPFCNPIAHKMKTGNPKSKTAS